jgi:hypothetical protein
MFPVQGRVFVFQPNTELPVKKAHTEEARLGEPVEKWIPAADGDKGGGWRRAGEGAKKDRVGKKKLTHCISFKALSITSSLNSRPIMEKLLPAAGRPQGDGVASGAPTSLRLVVPSGITNHAVSEAPRSSPSSLPHRSASFWPLVPVVAVQCCW